MKKVLFGITSLELGGAERVLVDLSNKISQDYDITIFTIYDKGILKKELSKNIKVISLYDKKYSEFNKLERIKISLKLLFKDKPPFGYETYISFLEGPVTRLFSKKIQKNAKRIAWIHNDISKVFGKSIKSKIKKVYDKHIYKKYNELIFVSEENKKDFDKVYGRITDEKIIRNYIDYKKVIEKSNKKENLPFSKNDINLLTVCRLVEQKAIDRFIDIHSELEKEGIHSKVYIVGDGPLRYKLQKQIDTLGETENFYLLGAKENPYPYIKNADYFCLLSYHEGYGMCIEEAKILNKRIIITDTAASEALEGYKESAILKNTKNGIQEGLKKIISKNPQEENKTLNNENLANIEKHYQNIMKEIKRVLD